MQKCVYVNFSEKRFQYFHQNARKVHNLPYPQKTLRTTMQWLKNCRSFVGHNIFKLNRIENMRIWHLSQRYYFFTFASGFMCVCVCVCVYMCMCTYGSGSQDLIPYYPDHQNENLDKILKMINCFGKISWIFSFILALKKCSLSLESFPECINIRLFFCHSNTYLRAHPKLL